MYWQKIEMFSWDTSFIQWAQIWRWMVSDWRVKLVFNSERKKGSKETERAKSGWRKSYQLLTNFWEFVFLDPQYKSGGKVLCFWKQNLGLYLYDSLYSASHLVFLLQHHCSSEPWESKQGNPATTATSLPLPHLRTLTAAQNEGELRAGRNLALRGENPPRTCPSKGPGTLLPRERSPLPTTETVGPVSDHRKPGCMFGRGEHFRWSMILTTTISLLSEVIIIFLFLF